jgi:hypothetical protein
MIAVTVFLIPCAGLPMPWVGILTENSGRVFYADSLILLILLLLDYINLVVV